MKGASTPPAAAPPGRGKRTDQRKIRALFCARSRPGRADKAAALRAPFLGSSLGAQRRTKNGIALQEWLGIGPGSCRGYLGPKYHPLFFLACPRKNQRRAPRNQPALRVPDPACPKAAAAPPLYSAFEHWSRQSANGGSRACMGISTPLAGAPHGRGWRTDQRNMLRPFAARPGGRRAGLAGSLLWFFLG